MVGVITATATVSTVLKAPAAANAKSKEEIADEFQRRRKALLAPLPAGRETRGSAFFPITTQARQLVLVCRSGAEICTVTIDLPAARGPSADESGSAETRDLRIVPANLLASN